MNSLSFCLSEKFISPSILKDNLTGRLSRWQAFSLQSSDGGLHLEPVSLPSEMCTEAVAEALSALELVSPSPKCVYQSRHWQRPLLP